MASVTLGSSVMTGIPELSVVIPVRDEEGSIGPLLAEINAALSGRVTFEVICVNDASQDGTLVVLRNLRPTYPWLRVISQELNAGQSSALRVGALAAQGIYMATLDGDGQNNPKDLLMLLEHLRRYQVERKPVQLVAGMRIKRQDNFIRLLSSRIANKVRGFLLRDGTRDSACGIKIFVRETFLQLPYFDHMHRFLPALFAREGYQTVSLPVDHRPRMAGKAKYGVWNRLWVGIVDIFGVMWLNRRRRNPGQILEE